MKKVLSILSLSVFTFVISTNIASAVDLTVPTVSNSNFQGIMNYSTEKQEFADYSAKKEAETPSIFSKLIFWKSNPTPAPVVTPAQNFETNSDGNIIIRSAQ